MSMSKPCALCAYENNGWGEPPCATCGPENPNFRAKLLGKEEEVFNKPVTGTSPEGLPMFDIEQSKTAVKFDGDKLPVHLVPIEAVHSLARVLQFGAKKYAARNWEKGMEWHRLYRAAINHLMLWFHNPDPDPESGLSHLDHAMACVSFLATYEARGIGVDDRPFKTKE